jgi:hypothetical protein
MRCRAALIFAPKSAESFRQRERAGETENPGSSHIRGFYLTARTTWIFDVAPVIFSFAVFLSARETAG